MTDFFTGNLSLWGLFLSSLLGATLLPGGSELMLIGVIKLNPELLWPAVAIGTVGNTVGAMLTFAVSWFLPLRHELKHADKIKRYGTASLLLSWLPLVGDALCVAAGFLRMNPWYSLLFIAIGKCARYAIIALTV